MRCHPTIQPGAAPSGLGGALVAATIAIAIAIAIAAPGLVFAADEGGDMPPRPFPLPFADRFSPYEPIYIAGEPGRVSDERSSNVKFQFSLAFLLVDLDPSGASGGTRRNGLHIAYSQLSFWDISSDSKPFYDTSYKPEVWYHQRLGACGRLNSLEVEAGYAHESNGKVEENSRSLDRLFIRPVAMLDVGDGWEAGLKPRIGYYLGRSGNEDIQRYRGYADVLATIGETHGLQIAVTARIGSRLDRGSLQTELSYPLDVLSRGRFAGYLYIQSFAGYSETLLDYDQRTSQPRILIGFALVR